MAPTKPAAVSRLERLVGGVRRNRRVFESFFIAVTTRDQARRQRALDEINDWSTRLRFDLSVGPAIKSLKGFASDLYERDEIRAALESVPHLGCLAPLARMRATRRDYVALIAEALLNIKEHNAGLGLGSTALAVNGVELSGLERL